MPVPLDELLTGARDRLRAASFSLSTREAALLLGHVLGWSEAQVLARTDEKIPEAARRRFESLLERRLTGEPVAYLLGEKEFYGRAFKVDRRVLIPRPETEHLVEAGLAVGLTAGARILDLGTGSGCLAVTLALEIPGASVVAIDRSPAAAAVAAGNARRHGVADRVRLAVGDLATAISCEGFDLVVGNPPYVGREEAAGLSPEVVDFEPGEALFAAGAGGEILGRIVGALGALRPGTSVLLEIGHRQGELLRDLAAASDLELEAIDPDLAGRPRIARLRRRV